MIHQFQFINEHHIVRAYQKGIVDVSEMNICKNMTIIHLKRLGWNRILLDLTDTEFQVGTLDVATLYKGLDKILSDGAFMAVLPPQKMDFDYCQYSKSIATEWSNTNVEIFAQEDLAIKWLTEQSKQEPSIAIESVISVT